MMAVIGAHRGVTREVKQHSPWTPHHEHRKVNPKDAPSAARPCASNPPGRLVMLPVLTAVNCSGLMIRSSGMRRPLPCPSRRWRPAIGHRRRSRRVLPQALACGLRRARSRVRITEGPFANWSGIVDRVLGDKGLVRVTLEIFNRPTPVELEYYQVE
jgi:hypothetical protein